MYVRDVASGGQESLSIPLRHRRVVIYVYSITFAFKSRSQVHVCDINTATNGQRFITKIFEVIFRFYL